LNLFIVFLVSGLWHGASWTFVVWGALHGTYLMAGIWLSPWREAVERITGLIRFPRVLAVIQVGITFSLVTFAWIFFRAQNLPEAWYIVTHLTTGLPAQLSSLQALSSSLAGVTMQRANWGLSVVMVALLLAVELRQHRRAWAINWTQQPTWLRWAVYQAAILILIVFGKFDNHAFIYFQF
jgi:D-alanyl-lipoteichoic acid acyltransferase DltB (MBOAT superfamily)